MKKSDDELRDRYFEKVSLPATSGSKYHYEQWAKEISGVGDAKCRRFGTAMELLRLSS